MFPSSSAVRLFPIPGSPTRSTTRPRPLAAEVSAARSTLSSSSRPTNGTSRNIRVFLYRPLRSGVRESVEDEVEGAGTDASIYQIGAPASRNLDPAYE